jgi:hypothetical protein
MNDQKANAKKGYRRPEITSRKLSLGVYGQYGVDDSHGRPERSRPGDHRDWKSL